MGDGSQARVMKMRPRLRADVRLVELNGGKTLAVSGDRVACLDSVKVKPLAPLLDGMRVMSDLWRSTSGIMPPSDVVRTVMQLEVLKLLSDGPAPASQPETAFCDAIENQGLLTIIPVVMIGLSDDLRRMVCDCLDHVTPKWARIEIDELEAGLGLNAPLIVVTNDYLADEIEVLNRLMRERGESWALVKPFTDEVWIGPVFRPGDESACWECLAQRLRGHRVLEKYVELETGRKCPSGVQSSGISTSVSFALSMLLLRMQAGDSRDLISVRLPDLEQQIHAVTRRPQCAVCGDMTVEPCQFELVSRPRRRDEEGRLVKRINTLEETRESLARHISPYSGIITKFTPIDTGSQLYFSAAAGHDFAPSRTDFGLLLKTLKGNLSGGKGRSPLQAEVSALCEAVERGLTMFTGDEPTVKASYREIENDAIDPSLLLGFSHAQYTHRALLNGANPSKYAFVPNPINPDVAMDWCWVKDLGGGPQKLVPASYCYYGHPDLYARCYCLADSNGTAAGGVLEEAIVGGFTELIERDCVGVWWYNRLRYPGIDLESLDDPYFEALRMEHMADGRTIWGLDLTNDAGVPCFALFSARLNDSPQDIIVSFGCDLDPRDAFDAAVDELNQFLPWVAKGEDGVTRYWGVEPEAVDWFKEARVESELYILPSETDSLTRIQDMTSLRTEDVQSDVFVCRDIAERIGSRMYVMNLSRPEIDIAVARVIVPGLSHFWRRLGSRRLYEVPVAMGHLKKPLKENDLNPRTLFF